MFIKTDFLDHCFPQKLIICLKEKVSLLILIGGLRKVSLLLMET